MKAVKVFIWNQLAGVVALDPTLGYYVFSYEPEFVKTGIELAPLQMPLRESNQPFVFTDLPTITYKKLPALLADTLPDDFGNALIDRYMAEQGIKASDITALDRLAYMGDRSMGALEFKPVLGPHAKTPIAIELSELVVLARQALQGHFEEDEQSHVALKNMIEVGTSAGGARAKAVIAWNPKTHEIRSGQLQAPDGFEHWLLKFDGVGRDQELGTSQDYGRIEYAYYLMAKSAGIHMSESRLLLEHGRAHFMTHRFDRESGIKHHVQSLCAMSHLDYKKKSANSYEQLFMTMQQLGLKPESFIEAFTRMAFNIMAKNCDDHTKNFSFLLRHGHRDWELAPAYDITFAHNPKGEWTHQHLMSVSGKFKDFELQDLLKVADRFGIGSAKQIIERVRQAIKQWPVFAKQAGLTEKETQTIGNFHEYL